MTEIIEIMARAAWEDRENTFPKRVVTTWKQGSALAKEMQRDQIRAALEAALEANYKLVPREPSEEMIKAKDLDEFQKNTDNVWQAMWDAVIRHPLT